MDFVTITYNNDLENELLKLQAHSFKFVREPFIQQIIVLFNDEKVHFFFL